MQSPLVIVLRASVLLGCLGFLPLMAAGGLSAPEKIYTQAQNFLATHIAHEPLLAQRTIQVELPADALRYREVGSPIDLTWEDSPELEVAEVIPASLEEISAPPSHDAITAGSAQPSSLRNTQSPLPSQVTDVDQVFELGDRTDPQAKTNSETASTVPGVETRLRELGAIDVRLEPWGSTGRLFRYCASVSVAGSAEVQRHFQSIGTNPDQAAQDVLAQVTAWVRQ